MTDEELAEIEARVDRCYLERLPADVRALLAEVRRLRAIEAGRTRYCETCEHTGRELERFRAIEVVARALVGDWAAWERGDVDEADAAHLIALRSAVSELETAATPAPLESPRSCAGAKGW